MNKFNIELTEGDIGILKCALARYKDFCDNCVSAFEGTGHDEHFKIQKKKTERMQEKFYAITINNDKE